MRRRRWQNAVSGHLQAAQENGLQRVRQPGVRDQLQGPDDGHAAFVQLYARSSRRSRLGVNGMANIPVGTKGEQKLLVTSENAINFLGQEGARVLSTPHMIGYMERTCRDTVLPLLDPGHDTVGTHVNVAHLAAAPMGMMVTFTCEVIGVNDRRVQFGAEAGGETERVGEGTQ